MNDDPPMRLKDVRATSPELAHALRALGRSSDLERLGRVALKLEGVLAGAALQPSAAASGGSLLGKWLMVGVLAAGGAAGFWGWRVERDRLQRMAAVHAAPAAADVSRSDGSAAPLVIANAAGPDSLGPTAASTSRAARAVRRRDSARAASAITPRAHGAAGSEPTQHFADAATTGDRTARSASGANIDDPTLRAARAATASDRTPSSATSANADDLTLRSASAAGVTDLTPRSPSTAEPQTPAGVPTPNEPATTRAALAGDREAPPTPAILHERSHSQPPPAAASRAGGERSEAALLLAARKAQPSAALELLAEHATRFPDGLLAPERDVLRIEALRKLGRGAEAASQLRAFEARYPDSLHLRRLVTSQLD